MADAIQAFILDVPAGNGGGLIHSVDCPLGWSDVSNIMITFPAGCSGLVGARIEYAGNQVYPISISGWFVLDDYVLQIPVTNQQQAGQWRLAAYNIDYYPHSITAYFSFNYLLPSNQPSSSGLISL
jgi:hypothetical protein